MDVKVYKKADGFPSASGCRESLDSYFYIHLFQHDTALMLYNYSNK